MTDGPHPGVRSRAKPAEPGRGEGELLWPSGSCLPEAAGWCGKGKLSIGPVVVKGYKVVTVILLKL